MELLFLVLLMPLLSCVFLAFALSTGLHVGRRWRSLTLCAMCFCILALTACSPLTKWQRCAEGIMKGDWASCSGTPEPAPLILPGPVNGPAKSPASFSQNSTGFMFSIYMVEPILPRSLRC